MDQDPFGIDFNEFVSLPAEDRRNLVIDQLAAQAEAWSDGSVTGRYALSIIAAARALAEAAFEAESDARSPGTLIFVVWMETYLAVGKSLAKLRQLGSIKGLM